VGRQIREIMKDNMFYETLSKVERRAWRAFKLETTNFLRNYKAENYKSLVEELFNSYKIMG
jgi:hypothetical protein